MVLDPHGAAVDVEYTKSGGRAPSGCKVFVRSAAAERHVFITEKLAGMLEFRTNGWRGDGSSKEEERDTKSFDPRKLKTCRTSGARDAN